MVVNARPLKRMKRRVTADLHDFLTFPSSSLSGCDVGVPGGGPFRANVRTFLAKHALLPPPSSLFPHLVTWQVLFRVGDLTEGPDSQPAVVCLDVVEEDVVRSRSVYCDQCRVVGWSGHPVCGKRYHFIIKADGSSIGGYQKPCMCCGDVLHLSESKCKSCNHVTSTDDVEDWVYHQLENTTHLLHGVVHSNGYGHLLRVNGREGGSRFLSGCHIMDFWDRLCRMLGVRKVSVMDVSKKYGLEYRLLHAVVKGQPWYGNWGYEFGAGSYALTLDSYKTAVETLSSLPLSNFLSQEPRSRLHDVIMYYETLSDRELVNIRDLFGFLMSLVYKAHKSSSADDAICRSRKVAPMRSWTKADSTRVEEAMFRVLRAVSPSNWVSGRALRGAVCKAGPPDLLDYCLTDIVGKLATDGMVVTSRSSPHSGSLEYRLEPGTASSSGATASSETSASSPPCKENLLQDLRFLYESMLYPQTMVSNGSQETRDLAISSAGKLLDCKQFLKDYKPEKTPSLDNSSALHISCEVDLSGELEDCSTNPPRELLVLPPNATILDLKVEATKAFQEIYVMFRRFYVEELVDFRGEDDSTQVRLLLGSKDSLRVRMCCAGPGKIAVSKFRMERGVERWTVECGCGAKDDDGERMLACDVCGVWQHTRCSGISDSDSVPARFICHRCQRSNPHIRSNVAVQI